MRPADPSTVAETSACRATVRSGRAPPRAAGMAPTHMGWTWKFGPSGEKVIGIGRVDPGGSRGCWMARLYRRIMPAGPVALRARHRVLRAAAALRTNSGYLFGISMAVGPTIVIPRN